MIGNGKYLYELYCVREQRFSDTSDNFSLFVVSSKKIRKYCKQEDSSGRVLKTQKKLEKLLKNELDGYHVVGVNDYITWDLEELEVIDLDELGKNK